MPPPASDYSRLCFFATRAVCRGLLRTGAGNCGAGFSRRGLRRACGRPGAGARWPRRFYLRSAGGGGYRVHSLRPGQPHQGNRDHFHGYAAVPERAALRLDQPLARFFPPLPRAKPPGSARHQVTLRMLLAHASGLPGYVRLFEAAGGARSNCSMPASAFPSNTRREAAPSIPIRDSSCWARRSRSLPAKGLETFCAREVFTPLAMTSTCFRPPADWRMAIPPTEEDLTFRHRIIQGEVQDENCFVLGWNRGPCRAFLQRARSTALRAMPPGAGSDYLRSETVQLFTDSY